jgi:RNA polymerase sigma-70 factor (ECF subfamily)
MRPPREQVLDELLVMRCQDGEADALEQLVLRWEGRLWRHAQRLTGDEAAAWDVLQESWLAVVRGIRRLADPATFGRWVYRIVTNKCADFIRRAARDRRLAERMQERARAAAAPPRPAAGGRCEAIRAALERLSPDRQVILALRYREEFTTAEIAEILGVAAGTVKSRLHHARNELKRIVEGIEP